MPRSVVGRASDGLQYNGFSIETLQTGSVFYVSNSTNLPKNGIAGSDGNDGKTPEKPKATLNGALAQCIAGRGDTIILMQGHAENIATATAINIAVAGVKIIGLGADLDRPTFTLMTSSTASLKILAQNVLIKNVLIVANVAATICVTLAALGVHLDCVEIRDGSASFVTGVSVVGGGANLADHCKMSCLRTQSAGATQAILLNEIADQLVIEDFESVGSYSTSGIQSTTAVTNIRINRPVIVNTGAGLAINFTSGSATGVIDDARVSATTMASIVSGGLVSINGLNGAAGAGAVLPADSITLVSAIKTLPQTTTTTVFTVSGGPVIINYLAAEVTTALGAVVTTLKFTSTDTASSTAVDICAAAAVTSAAVGTFLTVAMTALSTALQVNAGGTSLATQGQDNGIVIPAGVVAATTSASDTGNIRYRIKYTPLAPNSTVTVS